MNTLMEILKVILAVTVGTCAIYYFRIILCLFWFKAVPEFWKKITKKQRDE